jgi:hypothetical protein
MAIQQRWEIPTFMLEEALPGRIFAGKCKQGDIPEDVHLVLPGKRVYELQQYLQAQVTLSCNYFVTRWLVVITEEIRAALHQATAAPSEWVEPAQHQSLLEAGGGAEESVTEVRGVRMRPRKLKDRS